MNKSEQSILEYAKSCKKFTISELFAYLTKECSITKTSLSWYLSKLTETKKLIRVGRGVYSYANKQIFAPAPGKEVVELYNLLIVSFPFAHFCIYAGDIIAPLQHHLSSNHITYIETDREATDSVFNLLKEKKEVVFLKPTKELIYQYIDMNEKAIFVKPLISEAPVQEIEGIPSPTIEKLLVDIHKDSDFFYLQGVESRYMLENACALYSINENRLLRYASRRGIKEEIMSNLETLDK